MGWRLGGSNPPPSTHLISDNITAALPKKAEYDRTNLIP